MKNNARNIIYTLLEKEGGNWDAVFKRITKKEICENVKEAPSNFVSIVDTDYIYQLKNSHKPPFGYYQMQEHDDNCNILLIGDNVFNIHNILYTMGNRIYETKGCIEKCIIKAYSEIDAYTIAISLCDKIVITQKLEEKDKALVYVNIAILLGKDVYVQPTIHPSVNNQLIKDGAYLIDSAEDLLV